MHHTVQLKAGLTLRKIYTTKTAKERGILHYSKICSCHLKMGMQQSSERRISQEHAHLFNITS